MAMMSGIAANLGGQETSVCRHCHTGIVKSPYNGQWYHQRGDGNRGCRAASYVSGQGWDDTLKRSWVAAPQ